MSFCPVIMITLQQTMHTLNMDYVQNHPFTAFFFHWASSCVVFSHTFIYFIYTVLF